MLVDSSSVWIVREMAKHKDHAEDREEGGERRASVPAVGCLFLLVYLIGLTMWTPFYIVWPRRYPGLTYFQSVAVRFTLVRHIWGLVTGRR